MLCIDSELLSGLRLMYGVVGSGLFGCVVLLLMIWFCWFWSSGGWRLLLLLVLNGSSFRLLAVLICRC